MTSPPPSVAAAKAAVAERVSRETQQKFERYADLLQKWQSSINLVGRKTVPHLWSRHILDSLQLVSNAPERVAHWVDLGSGAGFPGLISAAAWLERQPETAFTLIEADQRKCVFLSEASRLLGVRVNIVRRRIEDVDSLGGDVVSARALAPLDLLCEYAETHLAPGGICLFLKGKSLQKEADEADKTWKMQLELIASQSDPDGVILRVKGLERVRT